MEGTTRLIENEPSLEKSGIRDMIRNDVNKSTKKGNSENIIIRPNNEIKKV